MPRYIDADKLDGMKYSPAGDEDSVNQLYMLGWNDAVDMLKNVPAAGVREDIRGKWIIGRSGNFGCSLCGNEPYHSDLENMNYCPNCGAKMQR